MTDEYDRENRIREDDEREPGEQEERSEARRSAGPRRSGAAPGSGPRRSSSGGDARRRRKVCQFCVDKVKTIDYKEVMLLRQFTSRSGRIVARRKTGACAKHQRMLAKAIKRARHIALMPYTASHTRSTRP